ncbi:hypothetical protein FQR65_LT00256 [Abscondita terminalis]|nr:hypothetical protein FQR65_LT00256 [Abscondita terminalis]
MGASKHAICRTPQLKNGRVNYLVKRRYAKFKCNIGFILAGDKLNICENGTWDGSPPKCVRSSCIKVQPPPNVIIYPSHRGGVLNFFCKPGFALRGDNITYCDGKKWDNRLPTCSEPTKPLPLSCDFETEDLCGWTHDLIHDFDWKRKQSNTAHSGFATVYDHTKGFGGDGHYMHIESSSIKENETARLISPIYDTTNSSNTCFEFFYYMHGSMGSQLRVYMKKISDSWNLNPNKAFFWKIGNHGNNWLNSWHDLGRIDEDFQIIIECIRGKSFFSDIAIDDVRVIPDCSDAFTTESDVSYSFDDNSVPSCLDRCNIPSNSSENVCDCDESCIDNNTCCVDYIAVCILGVTEEYESTTDWITSEEPNTSKKFKTIENTTTKKTTTVTTTRTTPKPVTTTKTTTTKASTRAITTTKRPTTITTTKRSTTITTTKRPTTTTTTKRPTTTTTTKRPTTTTTQNVQRQRPLQNVQQPPLHYVRQHRPPNRQPLKNRHLYE